MSASTRGGCGCSRGNAPSPRGVSRGRRAGGRRVGQAARLLIVGDSLTHASAYPNDLAKRLSEPGGPKWTMLGSIDQRGRRPGSPTKGTADGPGTGS